MRVPKMQHFKRKNLARVRLVGSDGKPKIVYLGKWGSDEAQRKYDQIVAEFLTSNRNPETVCITLNRLCIAYLKHAEEYYVKDGEQTSEVGVIRIALRVLVAASGKLPVRDFGPKKLKAVRDQMIAKGWVRKSINQHIKRIVRMLQWGVENELVPPDVHAGCKAVKSLAYGRSKAVEGESVEPVAEDDINAIEDFVPRQVWGMIQLQLETGMRPGEVRTIRLCDLDQSDPDAWEYLPARHKTQHYGRERRVYLNRRAQKIVAPFLTDDETAYLFSPSDAYTESQERRRANRKTPMTPSQAAREPVRLPRRTAGPCYTKDSYNRAITRACEIAFFEMPRGMSKEERKAWREDYCWSPNQLRHNSATAIENEFGEDVARSVLGHSSASTSRIYIKEDFEKAKNAMKARAKSRK